MGRRHFQTVRCAQFASALVWLAGCSTSTPGGAEPALPSSNVARGAGGVESQAPHAAEEAVRTGGDATRPSMGTSSDPGTAGSTGTSSSAVGAAGSGASASGTGGGVSDVAGRDVAGTDAAAGGAESTATDAGLPDAGGRALWPIAEDGWPIATPQDFGMDLTQLDALGDELYRASGRTRAGLVVVKEGALIYEKYWEGDAATTHQVFSCTKSWGSTLVGIAVRQGLIAVEDPVTKWVPQPAREVGDGALLKHLLTQTGHTTPAGTAFSYNSGSIINTLPEVLEAASGMSSYAFFQRFVAEPLQLSMQWPTCPANGCTGTRYKADYIQFGDQGPNAVLKSTIRDQAKLGWLWLDDGAWNGHKLLDETYIAAATEPSFEFQSVYGYLWWLNREGRSSVLSYNAEVPDDMYHAVGGIGNCSVAVLPSQRMVIAHVGGLDSAGLGGHWEVFAPLFKP